MTLVNTSVLNRVGNTPLVPLDSLSEGATTYHAKLEGHNPFGSVKDRAALWMIRDGEERGILTPGKSIIIEPTSGNTGIALTGDSKHSGIQDRGRGAREGKQRDQGDHKGPWRQGL